MSWPLPHSSARGVGLSANVRRLLPPSRFSREMRQERFAPGQTADGPGRVGNRFAPHANALLPLRWDSRAPSLPMGRFDFYPRFYRRTDGLRTREHRRKEQNEERGGSPLAFTPVAPPAVADYHSCRF